MARKFLYIVAGLIVLVLAGLFALRIWGTELSRIAFVPGRAFFADGSNSNTLRLSFSCADEAMIDEGMTRLGRLIRQAVA